MRYQSFYPFAQPRGNDFFNINNSAPLNTPPPAQDMFVPPTNGPASGPATNLFRQFQGALGGFQQGDPGGFQQGPFGGFQQGSPGGFQQGGPSGFQQGGPGGFQQGAGALGAPQRGAGAGGGRTMSYLQTADKFINTAQQLTPMVRQFAPMIQNVPALLRLYRGFQAAPNVAAATTATNAGAAAAPVARAAAAVTNGLSLPRIFQPPF
ncbi:VrrA/YqfQ family protein [Psychrobacillus sp. FSL H8-0484]|uniref:VrrA/YqfQ family protein n=1 Tax=Psychrobacillus sp. FSL H8-0484 TaxID=2921390 RepID=UPI0030FB4E2F